MEEDLRARVEWLERELQARTAVMEQLFAAYVLNEKEKDRPGFAAIVLKAFEDRISRELADSPEADRAAFLATYRRLFSRVTALPPWRANDLPYKVVGTIAYFWTRLRRRQGPPPE